MTELEVIASAFVGLIMLLVAAGAVAERKTRPRTQKFPRGKVARIASSARGLPFYYSESDSWTSSFEKATVYRRAKDLPDIILKRTAVLKWEPDRDIVQCVWRDLHDNKIVAGLVFYDE